MKLNKLFPMVVVVLMMTLSIPGYSTDLTPTDKNAPEAKAEVERLTNRLEEIKAMDVSTMSRSEKRAMRKEVKAIEKKMDAVGGGVYISAATLVLIIILLIIFL